ncbi:hypothetical protein FGRMN_11075 [Fusarium graminum]|nr:hypothetical protein FGRMN_11075 [Fusarium graminum]
MRDTNKARLGCLLETCPDSLKQARLENASYLEHAEVTEALRYRLFYPVKPQDRPSGACGAVTVDLGHEDTCREEEPRVDQDTSLRADLAVTLGTSHYYYDIQAVAISKDSAKEDPYATPREAAEEKKREYRSLGTFFHPLIFSAGGLMDKDTAQAYKNLQLQIGS